jgi:hypothetical protein
LFPGRAINRSIFIVEMFTKPGKRIVPGCFKRGLKTGNG